MVPRLDLLDTTVVNLVTAAQLEDGEDYAIQNASGNAAEVLLEERTDPDDASTGVSSRRLYPREVIIYRCDYNHPSVAQLSTPFQPAVLRFSGPI